MKFFNLLFSFIFMLGIGGCATGRSQAPSKKQSAEANFLNGNTQMAIDQFEFLVQSKDKNYALWSNQLGSIYLSQGDNEKALNAFLQAFYLMNNVAAFSELERKATSLTSAESNKAYKGDPYEKMYNSLYTGLLLYNSGDLENARAAFKNGILAGSDKTEDLYKSNEALLYLLASRMEYLLGNDSYGKDLLEQARDALLRASGANEPIIAREQTHRNDLRNYQEELSQICSNNVETTACGEDTLSSYDQQRMEVLRQKISSLEIQIQEDVKFRGVNDQFIDIQFLNTFIDKSNNVFLVIQTGKGPVKVRQGRYGEKAVFYGEDNSIKNLSITVDGQLIKSQPVIGDVYYQAITRGGRKMDYILKGKAQFKEGSAVLAQGLLSASATISQDNYRRGRYNSASNDTEVASGILALLGIGSAVMSSVTNSAADIRHWSLLPNKIWVYPLKLSQGTHNIIISSIGSDSMLSKDLEFNINDSQDKVYFIQ